MKILLNITLFICCFSNGLLAQRSIDLSLEERKEDLNVLVQTLLGKHQNPYNYHGKIRFNNKIRQVRNKLDKLNDQELQFAFQEILALCRDLHTEVLLRKNKRIPLSFYQFSNGVHITGASEIHKKPDRT